MLRLTLNNQDLDVFEDTSITMQWYSPFLTANIMPGSFSYPFNLPFSDNNKELLGYPEKTTKHGIPNNKLSGLKLYHSGILILIGALKIIKTEGVYRCYIVSDVGDLSLSLADKNLTDLTLNRGETWASITAKYSELKLAAAGSYPDYKYSVFPIINNKYLDNAPEQVKTIYQDDSNGGQINCWEINSSGIGDFIKSSESHGGQPVIFPYLCYVIDKIFEEHYYQVEYNEYMLDSELRKLVILSLNYVGLNKNLSRQLPEITIKKALVDLAQLFNIHYFISKQKKVVRIRSVEDIIVDRTYIDITNKVSKSEGKELSDMLSGYQFTFTPDSSDSYWEEVIKEIPQENYKGSVANQAALSGLSPVQGDIYLIEDIREYWEYNYNNDDPPILEWQFFSNNLMEIYVNGDGDRKFSTEVSPVEMEVDGQSIFIHNDDPVFSNVYCLLPRIEQEGNNLYNIGRKNNFSLRLLFARGMQNGIEGSTPYQYPLGTNDIYDYQGNAITGASLALRWDTSRGIIEKYWKNYLYWLENIRVDIEKEINFSASDLMNIEFDRKYRIGQSNYLITEISATFGINSIYPANVKLSKC